MQRPLFGHGIKGSDESGDNYIVSPHGALSSKTKNTGDGFWCPVCYGLKKYTWVENYHKRCESCRVKVAVMDQAKISKIMTRR